MYGRGVLKRSCGHSILCSGFRHHHCLHCQYMHHIPEVGSNHPQLFSQTAHYLRIIPISYHSPRLIEQHHCEVVDTFSHQYRVFPVEISLSSPPG